MILTSKLRDIGQSVWLDNITRSLVISGALQHYIDDFAVTGLTSNPTIFEHALRNSDSYDAAIHDAALAAHTLEDLFFDLALEDLKHAADMFAPVFSRTDGVDGWVSLEVSPLLARDAAATFAAAQTLRLRAGKPNLFIKIPGIPAGLPAIEEAIFAGIPVNVTLLFSADQYEAAADAYLRGVERRIRAGLNPAVGSVASVFVSRWDVAVAGRVSPELRNRLGLAVAQRIYQSYERLLSSARWRRAANAGARVQRLLWASTSVKEPTAPDIYYVKALAAPFTVDTMPEQTLKAFAEHGEVGNGLSSDGAESEAVLAGFVAAGIDLDALATQLQVEGTASFVNSWNDLMSCIRSKIAVGEGVGQ